MDTAQTEKLKALALAAEQMFGKWFSKFQAVDGISDDDAVEFIAACSPATVLDLIADNERLRARFEYIEDHATTQGGGHGFTLTCFVPVDCEDIGCGIDAAIEKEKA